MANEVLINRLYELVNEITRLGGEQERTSVVPGILVANANPPDLPSGYIKIVNPRDGTYVPCLIVSGLVVSDNDLVNVLFEKGTEPVALSQSSQSPSSGVKVFELWESDFGAVAWSTDATGNLSAAGAYDLTTTGDLTGTNIIVSDDILHAGDLDTGVSLEDDKIVIQAGALEMASFIEAATDEVVINDGQVDIDFRVEGDTESHLFFADAGNDVISIGEASFDNVKFNIGGGVEDAADNAFGMYMGGIVIAPGNTKDGFFGYFGGGAVDTGVANTVANAYGVYSAPVVKNGTGTITNAYGAYIRKSTTATNNYGAYIQGDVGINITAPAAELHIDQSSTTAAQPVLTLDQADLSEEYIDFITASTGVGDPVDTVTAVGTAYARLRVAVNGTFKYIQLHNA